MANLYHGTGIPYAQFPRDLIKQLPKMEGSDLFVYIYLLDTMHENKSPRFKISNGEICEGTGLTKNTVTAAMGRLADVELKFARFERPNGDVYTCIMCDSRTGERLPEYDPNRVYETAAEVFEGMEKEARAKRERTFGKDVHKLKVEQYRLYYETRLGQKLDADKTQQDVNCLFHSDGTPSMSLKLERGLWFCHSCGVGGDIIDFEQKYMIEVEHKTCDRHQALKNAAKTAGAPEILYKSATGNFKPEASYPYVDEQGKLLFMVYRFPPKNGKKNIRAAHLDSNNEWQFSVKGIRRVLYRLPEVLAAGTVAICEGEKDVDRVAGLKLLDSEGRPIAATTCPFGCKRGNWKEEYSKLLSNKRVIIFPDADKPGQAHAQRVYESVSRYAAAVKIVNFTADELGVKQDGKPGTDISDYLDNDRSAEHVAMKVGSDWLQVSTNADTNMVIDQRELIEV
jgi:5S rRNA maturation endonuclease (ribonuclease M5)